MIGKLTGNCSNEVIRFKINEIINAVDKINQRFDDIGIQLQAVKDELGIR